MSFPKLKTLTFEENPNSLPWLLMYCKISPLAILQFVLTPCSSFTTFMWGSSSANSLCPYRSLGLPCHFPRSLQCDICNLMNMWFIGYFWNLKLFATVDDQLIPCGCHWGQRLIKQREIFTEWINGQMQEWMSKHGFLMELLVEFDTKDPWFGRSDGEDQ